MCNQNTVGGPPPLIGQRNSSASSGTSGSSNLISGMMRPTHSSHSRTPVTTPPNMVMGFNMHNLQSGQSNQQQQIPATQVNIHLHKFVLFILIHLPNNVIRCRIQYKIIILCLYIILIVTYIVFFFFQLYDMSS